VISQGILSGRGGWFDVDVVAEDVVWVVFVFDPGQPGEFVGSVAGAEAGGVVVVRDVEVAASALCSRLQCVPERPSPGMVGRE
jgi:hypothetical protein